MPQDRFCFEILDHFEVEEVKGTGTSPSNRIAEAQGEHDRCASDALESFCTSPPQSVHLEEIGCPFCGNQSSHIVIEEEGYQCRKCHRCSLIYLSPRPSLPEIQKLYGSGRANRSAEAGILGFFSRRVHERHHLRIVKKFIKKGSLLEIGAGAGSFLYEARKGGFEVSGIDLNNIQASFIRKRLGICCEESPLSAFSFGGKKFDIIYHRDVISHFYDPIEEFKKINDRLENDGFLVFETGNLGDVREKYYKLFTRFQLPDHLFFFAEKNLEELLRRTGFEWVEAYRYSEVPLLWVMKILRRAIDLTVSRGERKNLQKSHTAPLKRNGFSLSWLARNAFNYFTYIMLYKIGCVMPKRGRPQSLLMVARKRRG